MAKVDRARETGSLVPWPCCGHSASIWLVERCTLVAKQNKKQKRTGVLCCVHFAQWKWWLSVVLLPSVNTTKELTRKSRPVYCFRLLSLLFLYAPNWSHRQISLHIQSQCNLKTLMYSKTNAKSKADSRHTSLCLCTWWCDDGVANCPKAEECYCHTRVECLNMGWR